MTAADNIPVGRVEQCLAGTCTPEQLFWKWPAVESVANEDFVGQASYALIFWLLWQDEWQRSGWLAVTLCYVLTSQLHLCQLSCDRTTQWLCITSSPRSYTSVSSAVTVLSDILLRRPISAYIVKVTIYSISDCFLFVSAPQYLF